jgi:hypothetical protein
MTKYPPEGRGERQILIEGTEHAFEVIVRPLHGFTAR